MFAPKLYSVLKIPAIEIFNSKYDIKIDINLYSVRQQDSMMLRQIRIITNDNGEFNKYIVFVDCNGSKGKKEEIKKLVLDGFFINGVHFSVSERSASMTRNAILGFIDSTIISKINQVVNMDLEINETVLSKWYAYRGLMFSSCHCLENYFPKVIVVPDYKKEIKNQRIKYLIEKETPYIDKNTGENRVWKTHDIEEGIKDVPLNVFDGAGIHHPEITNEIQKILSIEERPTSIMWRLPYSKGMTHEVDYTKYFKEHGIDFIQDIWGKWYSVEEKMIIFTESMYKGYKYFNKTNSYSDWDTYWSKFHKYNHCFGIAKWNFDKEREPCYTRANYQILQDLDLSFDDFKLLSRKSLDWAKKIVDGDNLYTYCFLGLTGDKLKPINNYAKAILKNPEMIKEESVRNFLKKQIQKYIDKMKCGKIYIKACYKFLVPDLIMLLEWIGGNRNPVGVLKDEECWSLGYNGEYLIERNPHICKSEHLILNAVENNEINKYCGNLENTIMINGYGLSCARLNGADQDGDLVLLIDEPIMKLGVDKYCPIVINLDEKLTALKENISLEAHADLICRTLVSLIGEDSNAATCYHNKSAKTKEVKEKYMKYIDILSIVNSFAIDYAKTGYIMQIPYHIAKYSKPFPYFMRYAGDYYERIYKSMEKGNSNYKFHKSFGSNMNRLCFMIENFHNMDIKWKKNSKFDYTVMYSGNEINEDDIFKKIELLYLDFNKQVRYLSSFEKKLHKYDEFKNELKAWDKDSAMNYYINWNGIYNKYKSAAEKICYDECKLADICVKICYEKHPKRSKKFIWAVSSSGVLKNIKQQNIMIPKKDNFGCYEYLGKKYSFISYDYSLYIE